MEKSFIFNSVNGDRRYKADDFREYFALFIGTGVFPNPSTNLQVIANNDLTVTIKKGSAWIKGAGYINTDDLVLNVDVADGVLNRIDRVVVRMDTVLRKNYAYVKKGQFASSPTAPTLQRDADAYEIALADISVSKGAISITQADITDLRLNKELCGIVHGTIDQLDTTTLYNQYTQGFELTKQEFEASFKSWFASLKNILDGDTAGNLLNLINQNTNSIDNLQQSVSLQLLDMATKDGTLQTNLNAEKINGKTATAMPLTTNKTDIIGMVNELFTNANNLKSDWANVVGSPLLSTDTSAQLKSKTQTLKNTMATNLTAKGVPSAGTSDLNVLANNISLIKNGIDLPSTIFKSISTNAYYNQPYFDFVYLNDRKYELNANNLYVYYPNDTLEKTISLSPTLASVNATTVCKIKNEKLIRFGLVSDQSKCVLCVHDIKNGVLLEQKDMNNTITNDMYRGGNFAYNGILNNTKLLYSQNGSAFAIKDLNNNGIIKFLPTGGYVYEVYKNLFLIFGMSDGISEFTTRKEVIYYDGSTFTSLSSTSDIGNNKLIYESLNLMYCLLKGGKY